MNTNKLVSGMFLILAALMVSSCKDLALGLGGSSIPQIVRSTASDVVYSCQNTDQEFGHGGHNDEIQSITRVNYSMNSRLLHYGENFNTSTSLGQIGDTAGGVPNQGLAIFLSFSLETLPNVGEGHIIFSGGNLVGDDEWVVSVENHGSGVHLYVSLSGIYAKNDSSKMLAMTIAQDTQYNLYVEHTGAVGTRTDGYSQTAQRVRASLSADFATKGIIYAEPIVFQPTTVSTNADIYPFSSNNIAADAPASGKIDMAVVFDEGLTTADYNAIHCISKAKFGGDIGSIDCSSIICSDLL